MMSLNPDDQGHRTAIGKWKDAKQLLQNQAASLRGEYQA